MKKVFNIPTKVCSDFDGYSFFSELDNYFNGCIKEQIALDFSKTTWFEANLCAALGALINKAENKFNQIRFVKLSSSLKDIFSRNHFLANFGGAKIPDHNSTTIKYRKNKIIEDKLIKEFLDRELIDKPDFPKLSEPAKYEIIRSIFEIYSNAVIHGDCEYVYSCGQFYPNKIPPRIDFTIVDIGKSIKKNVNDFLNSDLTGVDAILWALADNNTTKPKAKNIPGGLGLKIICEFARLNKGKVQIVSNNGYWQQTVSGESSKSLFHAFPGTLVNLEFNLDDKSFYYLKDEPIEEIIF
ncbi:MAG TPA: hypothetical protein PLL66_03770 [Bacteroidales bacterium]|nr:hypothetical protein [Bacteroidales bacterium]